MGGVAQGIEPPLVGGGTSVRSECLRGISADLQALSKEAHVHHGLGVVEDAGHVLGPRRLSRGQEEAGEQEPLQRERGMVTLP